VQTCPTKVFTFGDMLDPESQVSLKVEASQRKFRLLEHLGTEPSIYYLKGGDAYVG
jgi:Fe-S-cluster-containing dehydrogenase component